MVTTEEADELAMKYIHEYIKACGCEDSEDVAKALLKLTSTANNTVLQLFGNKVSDMFQSMNAENLSRFENRWRD